MIDVAHWNNFSKIPHIYDPWNNRTGINKRQINTTYMIGAKGKKSENIHQWTQITNLGSVAEWYRK